ncbi:SGNH/GDSL hydrolase family protein [Saccharothrix saharensis]|uniref:SGNH/GDSL hydrolase family protein n=1 Tax=Saccharothrix saharensis TaxID=571190 RepID=UPI00369DCB3F
MIHRMARLALAVVLLTAAPATADATTETYQWAALGDSYTAGVFIGAPLPAVGDENRDGCDRTTNSYPDLVHRSLSEFPPGGPVQLADFSCGGAEIRHIASDEQRPVSPVDAPDEWPLVSPQVRRAGLDEGTDVVTIGVGGNSLPFAGMLAKCVELGLSGRSCREHYENPPEGEEGIDAKFGRIQDEYITMLASVHDAAPNARVITVGYPAVLPEESTDCALTNWTELFSIRHDDIDWLRGVLERLNRTIQSTSSFFRDRYVDVYSSSVGHDACRPADEKWVEGICGDAEDYWPTQIALPGQPITCPGGKHATLVHPNARGHENVADHVERAVRIALLDR